MAGNPFSSKGNSSNRPLVAYTGKAASTLMSTTRHTIACGAVPQQLRKDDVPNPITLSAMASMFGSTEAAIKYNLLKAKEAATKGDAEEVKRCMQNISIIADFTHTVWGRNG